MIVRPVPNLRGGSKRSDKLPDSFIKDVLDRTRITDVIGPHVNLKKSGASLLGLCPFHNEKGPSFTVSESKQFYHCFGCGAHGDAIAFLSKYAGMTFRESVTELAEKLGMSLPTSDTNIAPQAPVAPLYDRLNLAYQFFRHCLKYTEKPKEYLRKRGVNAESLKRYGIAYAPEGWQSLAEAFPEYQSDPFLVQAGLVKEKDGRRYDAFRDRLIFAIKDPRGRIIGFGGRAFEENSQNAKYLNSPSSPLFDKSSVLFGLYEAKAAIQAKKQAIVVEGYMDTVMMAQYGIENVVASMGTACTPEQIDRLRIQAPEIVFTFDGDAAGLKAAWRAMENCLQFATESQTFRFCLLEGGKDPDDVARTEGREAFEKRIDEAQPLSTFFLTQLAKKFNDLQTPEDRAKFLGAGMEQLKRLPFGSHLYRIMRDELARAANVGVSEVLSLSRRPSTRRQSKDDEFWDNLVSAASHWSDIAKSKVEDVVNALDEDDYAELESEKFSCHAEQAFWELFLSLPDRPDQVEQEAKAEPENALALRDIAHNIDTIISRHKSRTRQARISAQYRLGEISEDEFIKARQRA